MIETDKVPAGLFYSDRKPQIYPAKKVNMNIVLAWKYSSCYFEIFMIEA